MTVSDYNKGKSVTDL